MPASPQAKPRVRRSAPQTAPELAVQTLPNGLKVATAPMPGFRTVSITAWLRTGSRDEPAALNGLTHFFEHMAFKGTAIRDARAITFAIERVGGSINAYTAKDHTAYEVQVLGEHTSVALDVLADVLCRSEFAQAEIERERRVILQEIAEAADDPESVAQDAFDRLAYPRQALGRPILGRARTIARITREDLIAFQARNCTAANLVITACGALDPERFMAQVQAHFGDLPAGQAIPRSAARYVGGFEHIEDDTEQTSVVIGWPAPARTTPQFVAFELLGELLGGGMSSPLFQAVRERKALAYQIDTWTEGLHDTGLIQITAGVSPRNLAALTQTVGEVIASAAQQIDPEDLERSRNTLAMRWARSLERPAALADLLGRELLVHDEVVSPAKRLEQMMATDEHALSQAVREMLAAPVTMTLVGRPSRTDPSKGLARALNASAS
jgi:predicted Zn-dependent peptidase